MTARPVDRDERTIAVQNATFKWGYLLVTYGLLASIAWRAFGKGEQSWDLLALVIGSGLLMTALQARERTIGWRATALTIAAVVIGAAVPVVMLLLVTGRG
jgi:hypothetical protein